SRSARCRSGTSRRCCSKNRRANRLFGEAFIKGVQRSELEFDRELADARRVGLRADASEAGVRDIRLNASEDHRVEQIEDLAAHAEPRRRPESEGAAEPE